MTAEIATRTDHRAEYTAGLRMLADLLDANPALPLPYERSITFYYLHASREDFTQAARILPGPLVKETRDGVSGPDTFRLLGALAGLHFEVVAKRDTVCERVVTGTETVTRQVPDPAVEVPLVEVTEVVETVEWRCSPLLAETAASVTP